MPNLPSLPELAASALQRALSMEPVVGGDRALLLGLAVEGDQVRPGLKLLDSEPLEKAVGEGRLLLVLSETERTALVYLALIRQGDETTVGLQIDCRASDSPKIASFGAPLGMKDGRPTPTGELWALNPIAELLLLGGPAN
jgi:hypothetical protein